jgi:transaldolase / glucose-6-phosphate isomerase
MKVKVEEGAANRMNQHGDITFSSGIYAEAIKAELHAWQRENKVQRLWQSDPTLWTNSDENKWTGWLNVASENDEVQRIEVLANELKDAGLTDIVVLGMGGSSLCPAMMADTFGKMADFPRLHIVDSTDPLQIYHLEKNINLQKSFFITSSKSGSTLEPNIFKDYFYAQLQKILHKTEVGERFLAITDPGTALETIAKNEHFKAIFYGVPSIGGRYSALSNFGMVPSGLMGVNIKEFLRHAETMQQACSSTVAAEDNPAVVLGVIVGVCAKQGKNKVTLIASPGIHSLGAWLEQLFAESTGKSGKGLIPVDQEPLGVPAVYGDDRLFIYIRLTSAPDPDQDRAVQAFEQAGFMVVRLNLVDKMHLGAELFRFEMATAVAGSIIGINPFNQPDVEESKVLTLQLTSQYEKTQQLTEPTPFFSDDGMTLFTSEKNAHEMTKQGVGAPSIRGYLQAHLHQLKKGDYVNLSAFIEMSAEHIDLLQESRVLIRDHKKVATCLGFGPRFLHSTGQAYKGGPNTGVFLQITADHSKDIPVPNHQYTFGLVITAQAQADFAVLVKRSRRVLRIHLGKDVRGGLQKLRECLRC